MAGKPGTWAKGQKVVKTVDLADGTTAEGIIVVDSDGNVAGGTGGGPATIANGADVAQGNTADVAWVSGSGTVISLLKKIASAGGSAVSVADGADTAQGTTTDASSANTVIGLLKAVKAAITGTVAVSGTFFQATQPVSGTFYQATQPVSGPLTDTQLRAATVPVSGTVTASGPLTDTQLRATPVPVSGTVATGALTDTQLRASAVPVSLASTTVTGTVAVTDNAGSLTVDAPVGTPAFVRLSDGVAAITALPVTDSGSSLTVDAPVATPVFTRLSDGAAALIGQKAMASSLPVSLASDQSTLPVSLATNTPDVTDRAAREVGRVRIWDGTDEATVLANRTQPASTDKGIVVFEPPNRLATYGVVTAEIAPAITIGVKELLALWHASTGTKDMYIVSIVVSVLVTTASTTAGRTNVRVSKITSAPTGGTEETTADLGGAGASDITNKMRVKTGGGALGTTFIRQGLEHATQPLGSTRYTVFQASAPGNGIILRAGVNDGISIDCERVAAHTALVDQWTVEVRWLEV